MLTRIIIVIVFLFPSPSSIAQIITKDGARYKFHNEIYTSYEIGDILENDIETKPYYEMFRSRIKRGRKTALFGAGVITGAIAYGYFLEKNLSCDGPCIPISWRIGFGGIIISIAGLVTSANGYTQLSKAIRIFNKNHITSGDISYSIDLGLSSSGLILELRF